MTNRHDELKAILKKYTDRYTSAQMEESWSQVERWSKEAQDWFEAQRKALKMSDNEIEAITEELYKEAKQEGRAFFCNIKRQ